jgi:FAD dependent oxidoreductase
VKVTIVGGGVVGLATAYSLVEAGCDVVLLDAEDIPNPSSASYDLSRMMRVQYGPQSGYAQLAKRALTSWVNLQNAFDTRLHHPTGVCLARHFRRLDRGDAARHSPCRASPIETSLRRPKRNACSSIGCWATASPPKRAECHSPRGCLRPWRPPWFVKGAPRPGQRHAMGRTAAACAGELKPHPPVSRLQLHEMGDDHEHGRQESAARSPSE